MIFIEQRNITDAELGMLPGQLPGPWKRAEDFVLKLLIIVPVFLAPLLIYDNSYPVRVEVQAFWCIAILSVAMLIARKWTKRSYRMLPVYMPDTVVDVVQVQTSRAFRREETEDFGFGFYVEVMLGEQTKTLFLIGQYLDMLEYDELDESTGLQTDKECAFPSTSFYFVRVAGSNEFLDFVVTGDYLPPAETLPALSMDCFLRGDAPQNGAILDIGLDELLLLERTKGSM